MNYLTNLPFDIYIRIYNFVFKLNYDIVVKELFEIEYIYSDRLSLRLNNQNNTFVKYFLETCYMTHDLIIRRPFIVIYSDILRVYNQQKLLTITLSKNENNITKISTTSKRF